VKGSLLFPLLLVATCTISKKGDLPVAMEGITSLRVAGKTAVAIAGVGAAVLALNQLIRSQRGQEEEPFDLFEFLARIASGQQSILPAPLTRIVERIQSNETLREIYERVNASARLKGLSALIASSTGLWVVSLFLKDASIIDSFWSLGIKTNIVLLSPSLFFV